MMNRGCYADRGLLGLALLASGTAFSLLASALPATAQISYTVTNLVSDGGAGSPTALRTDPNLINPWGMSASATSPFWVSDNGKGKTTLYNGTGAPQALVVTIPPPAGSPAGTISAPTGQVSNSFSATSFKATGNVTTAFIFDTEDGTIAAWGGALGTNAVTMVDNSASGAVYKGLAIGTNGTNNFLYAANFSQGKIDVFDATFASTTLAGAFVDPSLTAGYSPFNIQNLGGTLYVAYAPHASGSGDEIAGAGFGIVDAFDTNGNFLRRITTGTPGGSLSFLNDPWGLAIAPSNFGVFSNDLLVGNFGNGEIGAFNATTGTFQGLLSDKNGNPISIDGLWGLQFGNGAGSGPTNTLYFTAGPNGEANGLFGSITVTAPEPGSLALVGSGALSLWGICLPRLRRRRASDRIA